MSSLLKTIGGLLVAIIIANLQFLPMKYFVSICIIAIFLILWAFMYAAETRKNN